MIALALFLTGACIFLYPFVTESLADQKQQRLLESWEASSSVRKGETEEIREQHYAAVNRVLESGEGTKSARAADKSELLAVLRIAKIELSLPVVEGASAESLESAAGHVTGTAEVGYVGNSAIAAHRSHTYGRMFNRLDEVEIGDQLIIESKNGLMTFEVFSKTVVEPSDTSVLTQHTNEEKWITLITCTPMHNPTHRLIVQAKKVT